MHKGIKSHICLSRVYITTGPQGNAAVYTTEILHLFKVIVLRIFSNFLLIIVRLYHVAQPTLGAVSIAPNIDLKRLLT